MVDYTIDFVAKSREYSFKGENFQQINQNNHNLDPWHS